MASSGRGGWRKERKPAKWPGMRLRLGAALVQVVRYLIAPPHQGGPVDFNIHAPLSKWKVIDSYDDIGACEQGRMAHLGEWYYRASTDRAGTKAAENDTAMLIWLNDGQCVAADDPRLKPK